VSIQEPKTGGVSVVVSPDPDTTVQGVATAPMTDEQPAGLSVGLMVLISFAVTVLAALGDAAINGSLTFITGGVFVIVSVICAATVGYRDLSTAIITPPLAYFTAILVAGQPALLSGARDNLLLREVGMVVGGLAFNAPWIFAGTAAAAVIVVVRRYILHR
jgi:hypothetical protein